MLRFSGTVLLLLAGAAGGNAFAQAPPPDSVAAVAAADERPAFLLPDIVVEGEDLSRLAGGARLMALETPTIEPAEQPDMMPPAPTHYRRRATVPFDIALPPLRPLQRQQAFLRAGLTSDRGRALSAVWMPSPAVLFWFDDQAWDGRVSARRHEQLEAGAVVARPVAQPMWRAGLTLAAGREDWDRGAREGAWQESGTTAAPRGEAFFEQALGRGSGSVVVALRAAAGRSRTEICRDPACRQAQVRRTAGWQTMEIGLRRRGTPRDLRLLVGNGETRPAARRLEIDLQGGYVRRDNGVDAPVERARGMGRIGWTFPAHGGLLTAGIAGGGEGDAAGGVIGPYVTYHHAAAGSGTYVALEIAPEIRFAEEEGRPTARLTTPAAQGVRPRPAPPPAVPLLTDPLLPAQRAWPCITGEWFVRRSAGWLHVSATAAAVRDPFDWTSDSLAVGPALLASARGDDRWLATVAISGETRWMGGLRLRGRHRWVHDAEPREGAGLCWLPAHELRAALDGRWGALRMGAALSTRSRVDRDHVGEHRAGFTQLDARIGWCFGMHTLHLVASNLFGETITWWPGETVDDAWLGFEWQLAFSDAVP
ncbi:MAG: hypothetical protein KAY32_04940 [Candidatus Eisenbacteria sp.]|nr:hypothetical protein [Candidatus Eisenbacteria bacterium]